MTNYDSLDDNFLSCCHPLSSEDIWKLDAADNGPIRNVLNGFDKECYGVKLYEGENGLSVDMYFVTIDKVLKGDIIILYLNDLDYSTLLLRFCTMLAINYQRVDAIDAFNTLQKMLRGFLEKSDYFTVTNLELESFDGQSVTMVSVVKKGIFRLDFKRKVDFYREYFGGSFALDVVKGLEYVYLMINTDTSLFKIGTSKNPRYRERTLHSQEPVVHLIALWCCTKAIEKVLHSKYKYKRRRGEWFSLDLRDLLEIENFMAQELKH